MAKLTRFEIFAVDLPFKKPFKHAASERSVSNSLFLKCVTDSGVTGFGESLPREYVTGESRDGAYALLCDRILPRLIDKHFTSMEEVASFLRECGGKAPPDWIPAQVPQTAAWCAVDTALLDTFGRQFNEPALSIKQKPESRLRYSGVLSMDNGLDFFLPAFKYFLYGMNQMKLKVDQNVSISRLRMLRILLGPGSDIRVDVNQAWRSKDQAADWMRQLARHGIRLFEQPLPAGDTQQLSELIRETGLGVIADESFSDKNSLRLLINEKACTGVNIRISKCGGLMASIARSREALEAGLLIQVGCQVGESSLLSAAQLALISNIPETAYVEGCFGLRLLKEDPVRPILQFGYRGRLPKMPEGAGLGVEVDEKILKRWCVRHESIKGQFVKEGP